MAEILNTVAGRALDHVMERISPAIVVRSELRSSDADDERWVEVTIYNRSDQDRTVSPVHYEVTPKGAPSVTVDVLPAGWGIEQSGEDVRIPSHGRLVTTARIDALLLCVNTVDELSSGLVEVRPFVKHDGASVKGGRRHLVGRKR